MNNKGITLVSLSMYIVGLALIVISVAAITSFFYENVVDLRESVDSLGEFDKFNIAFLEETKNNKVSMLAESLVKFSGGTVIQFQGNEIYKNYVKICEQVKECKFSSETMGDKLVIKVYLEIGTDFAKTLEYVANVDNEGYEEETTSRIRFSRNTLIWTNENVTVTLSCANIPEGYVLQYKVGNGEWTTGTSATVTSNNTIVYGRLYNSSLNDEIAGNSVTITNIDKVDPTAPTGMTQSTTTTSISVTATGGTDSLSGVAGYQYSRDNSNWSETVASGTAYTFDSLSAATSYTIYARTVDNVGRVSSSYSKPIQTSGTIITGIALTNKNLTYISESTTKPSTTITPTITPSNATNKSLTWTSSDTNVATVNESGVVTYVGVGTATITATAKDGSGVSGTCTITTTAINSAYSCTWTGLGETAPTWISFDATDAKSISVTISSAWGSGDYYIALNLKDSAGVFWYRVYSNDPIAEGRPRMSPGNTFNIDLSNKTGRVIVYAYLVNYTYNNDGDWGSCGFGIKDVSIIY